MAFCVGYGRFLTLQFGLHEWSKGSWLERLQKFDFTILHHQGKKHKNADAFSRLPCQQCGYDSHSEEVQVVVLTSLVGGENVGKLQKEDTCHLTFRLAEVL